MGGGSYDGDVADRSRSTRSDHFTYTAQMRSEQTQAEERKCHASLDPKKKRKRECRDNEDHPNSTPIGVASDGTRSRGNDARVIFKKLPRLIGECYMYQFSPDPTISFGIVGDATCDVAPIQVGEYEADNRLDAVLGNTWLEEGGGGTGQESYELMAYYHARHSELDCLKRGKKGFFFFLGDEAPYPEVNAEQVEQFIGDKLRSNIPTPQIFAELQQKFHTFLIFPRKGWEERRKDIDEEIKQRVTRAGGLYENVDIRFSLAWNNRNDLDLHVVTPSGYHIYFRDKKAPCGGYLDVDMNVNGETTKPVENTRWAKGKGRPGHRHADRQKQGGKADFFDHLGPPRCCRVALCCLLCASTVSHN